MADPIKHITQLGFDVSQIDTQLNDIKTKLKNTAQEINNGAEYKINLETDKTQVEEATGSVNQYGEEVKEVSKQVKEANTTSNNFLKTITDKARWLAAFYLITLVKDAFFETISIIRDTETAVVELQRVLSEDVAGSLVSDELYAIAQLYGRTFDEVSETAVKFAQTGAGWNETLALTEATMLAVNTAELEVESATTGLIAVMSQFGLTTADVEQTIDKINITADNFAVTSEKIVDALQRTGSSARNANLSLEETISLITAMSEATGRSGAVMGTAINSLLTFSSRSESLRVFAELGGDVETAVEAYQTGAASIIDVWTALSAELENLSTQQADILFGSQQYQDFANELELQASELTEDIKNVYETAGTQRQNYFIALLNNFETVDAAMENMLGSENYSQEENIKAMSTLERQITSLKASAEELAVGFGEAGFTDLLKNLVGTSQFVLELVKNFGGLNTVITVTTAILVAFKKQQTTAVYTAFLTAINKLSVAFQGYTASVASAQGVTATFKAVVNPLYSLIVNNPLSVAILAWGAFSAAIEGNKQAAEERLSIASQTIQSLQSEQEEINRLVQNYSRLANSNVEVVSREEILNLQKEITELTGLEFENRNDSVEATKEQARELAMLSMNELANSSSEAQASLNEIEKQLENITNIGFLDALMGEDFVMSDIQYLETLLFQFTKDAEEAQKISQELLSPTSPKELENALIRARELLVDMYSAGEISDSEYFNFMEELEGRLTPLTDLLQKFGEAQNYAFSTEAAEDVRTYSQIMLDGMLDTNEELEKYIAHVEENIALSDDQREAYISYATALVSTLNPALEATGEMIGQLTADFEAWQTALDLINENVDNSQSAFQTLNDVITEYNTTGMLQLDTLQKYLSLSPEYASSIGFQGNQISYLNSETGELVNSQSQLIANLIREQTAFQIAALAAEYQKQATEELATASANATGGVESLESSALNLVDAFFVAGGAIAATDDAIANFGKSVGITNDKQQAFNRDVEQILQNSLNLSKSIGSVGQAYGGLSDSTEKYSQAQIDSLEAQKQAVEDRYNAEIDALRAVEAENDRIRAKEEYERNRLDAQDDIAQASARSGADAREDLYSAQDALADLDRGWQEQLEDWAIEDRIAELEALRDAETAIIESQIQALRDLTSSASSSLSNITSGFSEGFTTAIQTVSENALNATIQANQDVSDGLVQSQEELAKNMLNIMIAGYINPMSSQIALLQAGMTFGLGSLSSSVPNLSLTASEKLWNAFHPTEQTQSNENTDKNSSVVDNSRSMNVYVNPSNSADVNKLQRDMDSFINSPY